MSKNSSKNCCPKCGVEVPAEKQFCPNCLFNYAYWKKNGVEYVETQRTSLRLDSTYEKKFMFNNKEWRDDIKARRKLPDGTIGRFKRTRSGLERYK